MASEEIYEFSVMDPEEFSEYLATSVYYDYVEDKLLEQKDAVLCVYAPNNGQGAEKLKKCGVWRSRRNKAARLCG